MKRKQSLVKTNEDDGKGKKLHLKQGVVDSLTERRKPMRSAGSMVTYHILSEDDDESDETDESTIEQDQKEDDSESESNNDSHERTDESDCSELNEQDHDENDDASSDCTEESTNLHGQGEDEDANCIENATTTRNDKQTKIEQTNDSVERRKSFGRDRYKKHEGVTYNKKPRLKWRMVINTPNGEKMNIYYSTKEEAQTNFQNAKADIANGCFDERNYRRGKSSQFKGVTFIPKFQNWCSYIQVQGKRYYLGSFLNEEEASQQYEMALKDVKTGTFNPNDWARKKTSRYPDVNLDSHSGRWRAYVHLKDKRLYLGSFCNEEDADKAVKTAKSSIERNDFIPPDHSVKTTGSSMHKGVCLERRLMKWKAQIHRRGKTYHLGLFHNELEAARTYEKFAQARDAKEFDSLYERLLKENAREPSSKFKGVHFNRSAGRWAARINVQGKGYYLGSYKDELEAAKTFEKFAKARDDGDFENVYEKFVKAIENRESSSGFRLATKYNGSSKYRGVFLDQQRRKWRPSIKFKGKIYHLGSFDDELEAAKTFERFTQARKGGNFLTEYEAFIKMKDGQECPSDRRFFSQQWIIEVQRSLL
jgi:hypothetical protein